MYKALGLIVFLCASAANAAVIDFEDQGIAAGVQVDLPANTGVTSGGFYFINGPDEVCCSDLHLLNQAGNSLGDSTELAAHGDLLAMQASGGGSFSLYSFDFGSIFDEGFSALNVVGNYLGGGSVTQAFSLDGDLDTYDTILLSGAFTNLESVNWLATGGNQGTFYIDNIVVNAVPVPAAVWLFTSGLGLLAWIRRRAGAS
jgi:hypothetical protein